MILASRTCRAQVIAQQIADGESELCPECEGEGTVEACEGTWQYTCPTCGGEGTVSTLG